MTNTTQDELVSIVMCTLRTKKEYFDRALESILNQDYKNIEVIIEEEPSECTQEHNPLINSDHRIKYELYHARTSEVEQRNRAMSRATGNLIALMDADDISDQTRISKQLAVFNKHPELDVVGSWLQFISANETKMGIRRYPMSHEKILQSFPSYNPIAQPSVMLKKTAFSNSQGYQYSKYDVNSDYELWSRMAKDGSRFLNIPEALLFYRIHGQSEKSRKIKKIIRSTLDIKTLHWKQEFKPNDWLRFLGEKIILWLPTQIILPLFFLSVLSVRTTKKP